MQNGKCRIHGGLTPSGIAHHAYKGRGYSIYLSQERGEALEAITSDDSALVNLTEEIGLLKLRIIDQIKREKTGERGTLWDDLQYAVSEAENAGTSLDPATLAPIIEAGRCKEAVWNEIRQLIQEASKVIGTEGKRRADMGEVTTKDQVRALIVSLSNYFRDAVMDAACYPEIEAEQRKTIADLILRRAARDMASVVNPRPAKEIPEG